MDPYDELKSERSDIFTLLLSWIKYPYNTPNLLLRILCLLQIMYHSWVIYNIHNESKLKTVYEGELGWLESIIVYYFKIPTFPETSDRRGFFKFRKQTLAC